MVGGEVRAREGARVSTLRSLVVASLWLWLLLLKTVATTL